MPEFITVENHDAITILTFNRPKLRNALSEALRQEVITALAAFNADDNQRAMILTGAGDKAFSAGQDLKEAEDINAETAAEWQEQMRSYLAAIRDLDKPCIAASMATPLALGFIQRCCAISASPTPAFAWDSLSSTSVSRALSAHG